MLVKDLSRKERARLIEKINLLQLGIPSHIFLNLVAL